MIPLNDRGLLLGDGLFETMVWIDGTLPHLAAHLARLTAGCEVLGLPAPEPEAAAALCRAAPGQAGITAGRAAVRLTLTAGSGGRGLDRPDAPAPRLVATAAASTPPSGPASLCLSSVRRNEGSPASRLKSLAYLDNVLARQQARAAGADEAVMLNNRGELACATAANLFWIRNDVIHTPDLACGVLDGITRGRVLASARTLGIEARLTALPVEALAEADAAFLTNSLIGVRAVSRFEDRSYATHPLIGQLAAAL
jgi:branched-subunit amino acid aminotransferase/4-amino-4-deoxychorismate lyase